VSDKLSRDEIQAMKAGREMDALIGRAFGVEKWCPEHQDGFDAPCFCDRGPPHTWHIREALPRFSTDIAAAWQVVKKLSDDIGPVSVCWGIYGPEGNKASVMSMFGPDPGAVGETAPLAICRYALLATMESEHELYTES